MANNRMYIVDETSKYYICVAKEFGYWQVGNSELLERFLDDFSHNKLKILHESSDEFLKLPDDYINYNISGGWQIHN